MKRGSFLYALSGALVLALALALPKAVSAPLYWDGDEAAPVGGGPGVWDTVLANWNPNPAAPPPANQAWNNLALDDAVFLGAPGAVNIGEPITAHDLTFGVSGYRLIGPAPLTLAGTTPAVSVANAGHWAVIGARLAGAAGLTRTGAGQLFLNGLNTFSGPVALNGGTTSIINNTAMGDPANVVTLEGGTLQLINVSGSAGGLYFQLGNPASGGARVIEVGAGGGTIDVPALSSGNNGAAITGANALTGSGTLTKTGLGFLFLTSPTDFSGDLVIGPNGNQFDIRAQGAMPNVASVTINQSSYLNVSNQWRLMSRQFPGGEQGATYSNNNRFNDAAPVLLQGGRLMYNARNAALSGNSSQEVFGPTTVGFGQSEIRAEVAGGGGADLTISNLIRTYGGGTVRFTAQNTIGTAGNHGRIILDQLNGAAPTTGMFLGGWAVVDSSNFATYVVPASLGAAGGVVPYGSTVAGAPGYDAPPLASGKIVNLTSDYTIPAGDSVVGALRFAGTATRQLLFTNAGDTLYVESGGILSDGSNNARNIGVTGTRGRLTAGTTTATTPQELFLHNNSNTFTIWSQIINNPSDAAATVALIKDLDGQVNLENNQNSYSGGTTVLRGTLEARTSGTLGYGSVVVKNSRLNLNAAGAINAAASAGGYTIVDNGQIYLNSTQNYSTTWDRFTVPAGGVLSGQNSNTANQGLGSLTRVAALTGGGQVVLAPGAIVAHNSHFNDALNGTGNRTVQNLGTNADLFYGLYSDFNPGSSGSITVGAVTPWTGISTDRSDRRFTQGTIVANSDFTLQGLLRDNAYVVLNLGGTGGGTYGITNASGGPINANVVGRVALDENSPVSLPSDLTFVVTPGAVLYANYSNSLGNGSSFANVRVQAGGTLDPGNFPNWSTVPGPLNGGLVTVEAGGRFLINDASGIGSGQAGNITMEGDSILELVHVNAFFGNNAGLINPGQFVYQPGAIVRMNTSSVWKMSQFISAAPGGERVAYEVFNGDRALTNQLNPNVAVGPGNARFAPENITIANGGMLTNDSNDRSLTYGRGRIIVGDGAVLAGTSQTYFNIQQALDIQAGATVYIGTDRWVDGNPKLGAAQFTGPNSNTAGPGVTFNVVDGAQLSFSAINSIPDTAGVHLPAAVTYWPPITNPPPGAWVHQPGNGSSLLINANVGYTGAEVIGPLTGSGAIISNQDNAYILAGWGASSDFTFDGVFKKTASNRNPGLVKVGPTTMTMTNTSDTTAELQVMGGGLTFDGAGPVGFGTTLRIGKTGTLTLDNTANAVSNRLGTATRNIAGQGGTLNLVGNDTTPVSESVSNLWTGGTPAGSLTYLNVTPGAAATTFTVATLQDFNAGGRQAAWVLRSPSLANLPGTYDANNAYTPHPGNTANGLIIATAPNLVTRQQFSQGANLIAGAIGTPLVMTRPDLLGDTDASGPGVGFVTQDNNTTAGFRLLSTAEYAGYVRPNMIANVNVALTGATTARGDTRIQTLTMAPGSSIDVGGTLPLNSTPSRLYLYTPGILVQPGGSATIAGAGSFLEAGRGGAPLYIYAQGDLDILPTVVSSSGIFKTGPGTVNFGPGTLTTWRAPGFATAEGGFTITDGTVNLAPNNTFYMFRGQNYFSGPNLNVSGGTLNLGGNSQTVWALSSANWIPYGATAGGTITSASPATLTVQGGGTFSGQLTRALALDKVSNNTLLLTGNAPYTGPTAVRGGTLQLRDEARIANTSQLDINYATLLLDNGYLAGYSGRINPAATVNMRGGTLDLRGQAGALIQENLDTVNLLQGQTTLNLNAGGAGAAEIATGNLNRAAGSGTLLNITTGWGFLGTPGNDTTADRVLVTNLNGSPLALTNNILGGWAIVGGNSFATYLPGQGIGALNTALTASDDGFPGYDSDNVTTALATHNVNDGASRSITASRTVNAVRNAPNAAGTWTISSGQTLTIASGGLLTNNNNVFTYTGGFLTSGSGELDVFVNQNRTDITSQITGNIDLVKGGGGTLRLQGNNLYTGATYVNAGILELNRSGANASTDVAIPGSLVIHNATVTELIAQQIRNTANVTLYGGGILNLHNSTATETLASLTLINIGGGTNNNMPSVQRTAAQAGFLNLTAPTAITALTDNPYSTPTIHSNIGTVNFTGAAGQQVNVTGPSAADTLGLIINANIGTIPSGGLVKTGPGMLALGGTGTAQFGNPGSTTNVLDIQEGMVRIDNSNVLNNRFAVTTVQDGAALLGRNVTILGGVTLNTGSALGTTEGSLTIGAQTTGPANLTTLNVAGNSTLYVADYFMQGTQNYDVTLNAKLTGSGDINVIGPRLTSTVGVLRLGNNIADDPTLPGISLGANDFSGTITLNPNTALWAQATASAVTGNQLGTATVHLAGGELRLRDNNSVNYGNNVILSANSFLNANNAGSGSGNTITLGTLTVPSGAPALTTTFTGGSFWTANNSYQLAFAALDGAGTFVKGGHQLININSIAPTFSGNIEVPGPQGIAVPPSAGLVLPASASLQNFTVDGIHHVGAGSTLNVAGTLRIGDNAGQVVNGTGGVTSGSVTGALLIPNTATITANILDNRGVIGSSGGAATLAANEIRGTGTFQTHGQPILLTGPAGGPVALNDGATPSALKFAGNNQVDLNPASGGTITGGIEVQSGTLRIAPSALATDPFGAAPIQVLGFPVQTVPADGIPVNVPAPTLIFDGAANAIAHGGDIVNSGLVRVASGSVTVAGTLAGPGPNAYAPGLIEGRVSTGSLDTSATRVANAGNFGVKLEPRGGQLNVVTQNAVTGWTDNDLWVYTGQFYDADGLFSFLANVDDRTAIWIDGVRAMYHSGNLVVSTATTVGQRDSTITANANPSGGTLDFGMGPNNDGWHNIEIRFNNGGGGAGAYNAYNNGIHNNFGFGLNQDGTRGLDGALYTRPIDPGDGSLFRTPIAAQGNIQIDSGASLILTAPGATHRTNNLTVGGAAGVANLQTHTTSSLEIQGSLLGSSTHSLNLVNANLVFNSNSDQKAIPNITGTGSLTKLGTGTLTIGSNANSYVGPTFINEGSVAATGTGLGTGTVTVALGATLSLESYQAGLKGEYYNVAPPSPHTAFGTFATFNSYLDAFVPNLISYSTAAGATFDFATNGSNFPAPYNSGATNFQVRWTGKFTAPVAGNYYFWTGSDDGSMVWIDGQEPAAVNNNYFQGVTWRGGTAVPLTAGLHDITIGFYQGTGGYGLQADVQGPAGSGLETRQRLPNSYLLGGVFGDLTIGSLAGAGDVLLGAFNLTTGGDGSSTTFSGTIAGTGGLTKTGAGKFTLSGPNTYTGPTTVSQGILSVEGSIVPSSLITVYPGATIMGGGSAGPLEVLGTLAPGGSVGNLSALQTTFHGDAIYLWEINDFGGSAGNDPGWDQLSVNGLLTIGATMANPFIIEVISLSGSAPGPAAGTLADGQAFRIVYAPDGIIGYDPSNFQINTSFFLNSPGTSGFAIDQRADGLYLVYSSFQEIPEPTTLTLLALGGLALLRRRRRRQAA